MKTFEKARHGYKTEEVDDYIIELFNKLEEKEQENASLKTKLKEYQEKDLEIKQKSENISIALTAAVEKAKQIEKSSYNVYQLKIQELELLYNRWERVLNELIEKYPKLDEINNVKKLMQDFKNAIRASIKEDFRFVNSSTIAPVADPMRALLYKMNAQADKQLDNGKKIKTKHHTRKQLPKDMQTKQTEISKLEEKSFMIKPIYNANIETGEKFESLVDKFLTEDATPDSAYANKITSKGIMSKTSEDGFDLKEAVNPKADLEEIMKSFDFGADD